MIDQFHVVSEVIDQFHVVSEVIDQFHVGLKYSKRRCSKTVVFFCFCAVNKQINDKERVAAAMENPNLREIVEQCVSEPDD